MIIERWRSNLADALNRRFTSSSQNIEKRHLQAAMVALQKHQVAVSKSFVTALTNTLASGTQTAPNGQTENSRGFSAARSFDDLELMGDNQVQDTVDSLRVLQTVALESEAGLAAFTARLSTALGFAQVKADKNPLRPEIFSRALLVAVQSVPVDNAIRSLWFTHGSALMGIQVRALYLALNELLIEKGVEPAAYRVITDQESNIAEKENITSRNGSSWTDALESSAFAPLADFSGELPTIAFPQQKAELKTSLPKEVLPIDSEPIGHQDFAGTAPAAMTSLNEPEQHANVTPQSQTKALNTSPLRLAQLREQFKLKAKNSGQSRAVEEMSLMIEKLVKDPRLLTPVQQIIANAEPVFLRLAITDPGFFTAKSHPARNLLNTIASKSMAFANEGSPGFAEFLQDLQDVAALLSEGGTNAAPNFARLLAGFEKKIDQRHSIAYENHRATTQALLESEQRNILARKISAEILSRPDFILGNLVIAEFLTGPWSQVLAKERLAVESDKTGVYRAIFSLTLGELLWSLDGTRTASQPKQLAKLIPSILERLHGGLRSINAPIADSQTFFDELLTIYQSSLNASAESMKAGGKRGVSAQNKPPELDLKSLFGAGDSAYDRNLRQTPQEARHSRSAEGVLQRSEPRFQQTQPFFDTAGGKLEPVLPVIRLGGIELQLGAWVELMEGEQWLRAQLTWISLYKTLFMFTSAGGRMHSMTEPLLVYYLLQGQVKIISHEGVLAGSLGPNGSPLGI